MTYGDDDDNDGRDEGADGHVDAVRVIQMQRQWRLQFQFATAQSVVADRASDDIVMFAFATDGHRICRKKAGKFKHKNNIINFRVLKSKKYIYL